MGILIELRNTLVSSSTEISDMDHVHFPLVLPASTSYSNQAMSCPTGQTLFIRRRTSTMARPR